MKISFETVKIEIKYEDAEMLKEELCEFLKEVESASQGMADEAMIREKYPKVNELLKLLNAYKSYPF